MSLGQTLSGFWRSLQGDFFRGLRSSWVRSARGIGALSPCSSLRGSRASFPISVVWPVEDRAALARAFIAKAVFDVPTTRGLIERLEADKTLRRLCGWTWHGEIPSEATFSRAFAEFSERSLPARVHEALIKQTLGDHLAGHVSRDATAIEAREKLCSRSPRRRRRRPPPQGARSGPGRSAA